MARDLDFFDQIQVLRNSLTRGDMDLLSRALADPNILSPADNQTLAESLGLKGGLASWAVNVIGDRACQSDGERKLSKEGSEVCHDSLTVVAAATRLA